MAPIQSRKRTSDLFDLVPSASEDEVQDVRRKPSMNKRARLSLEASPEEDLLSDQRDGDVDDEDAEDIVTDDDSSADADAQEEDDDAVITAADKAATRMSRADAPNVAAECAIIEEIICTNFMCHEHLAVKIGPLINFIIGHNGSGKSAVLTAIQICLGGKATATNRGQNLKSFIKEGKDYSILSVRLKNQGEAAYKPEEYGKSIIVERHFNRAGTSGFKIKNATGKIISTRRDDLTDILDVFALQLDNPMNVLTQDMARQFLNNSTPQDKYKFFQKGTHLEQLDQDYREVESYLEQIHAKTSNVEEDRKILKADYERKAERLRLAENQQNLYDMKRTHQRQLAWALVRDQETDLAELEDKVNAATRIVEDRQQAVALLDDQMTELERKKEEAQAQLKRIQDETVPAQQAFDDRKQDFDKVGTELAAMLSDERTAYIAIQGHRKEMKKHEMDIRQEEQKLADNDNGQHALRLQQIEDLQAEKAQIEADKERLRADEVSVRSRDLKARDETRPLDEKLREAQRAVAAQEDIIRKLQGATSGDSWMEAYHPSLKRLLQEINRNKNRFREMPVGPLGRQIQLLNPEWSSILEKSFGAVLEGFAVTSKDDQKVLSGLMRTAGYNGRVTIGSSRPFERALQEPPEDVLTWRRAMKIENQLVDNIILINQSPEQTVLIEDREAGVRYQSTRPAYVKAILTMHDDRRGDGQRLTLGAGGGESSSFIQAWRGKARMQSDEATRTNIAKEALQQRKRDLHEAEQRLREARDKAKEASQEATRLGREMQRTEERRQRLEDQIEKLQDELQAAIPETGKLDALKESLRTASEAKDFEEEQFANLIQVKDDAKKRQAAMKAELTELKGALDETATRVKKAEAKVKTAEGHRHNAVLEKNEAHGKVNDAERALERAAAARDEQQATVDEYLQHANTISARVPLPKGSTSASIEKLVDSVQRQIEQADRELGGTREEIQAAAHAARKKYKKAESKWGEYTRIVSRLNKSLENRRERWRLFRQYIGISANSMFIFFLSERQFRGRLDIDHSKKLLDIQVEPDQRQLNGQGRQTKTLSGGEKSFSTICLLLALWEAMGSPIRCLDEFDVFMDSVNREVAMEMIIGAARRSAGRQFILITPQAMGGIELQSDVRIHRMHDPERGQTALPFGRAAAA